MVCEFAVVLGAGLRPDGAPAPILAARLDRARGLGAPYVVVSGGKGEAKAMRAYLTDHGVSPASILLEPRSRNTEENLRFSRELMDEVSPGARCVIVTSVFHVPRTQMLARRLGIQGDVIGAPVPPRFWPGALLRESAAFVKFLAGGAA
ncbi:MAG: YdcF family protein [Streptosporangiales bacterium]|jgi:uncharacterized SAM-binding protein YcdF (DUF218 family)|nr:YdcF family protein [Streptosporangiales bacterium]